MGLFDTFTKKQLQRAKLVDIITNWYKQNENTVDNEKYLQFLNCLEDEINKHNFKKDNRFVTYGRRQMLKQEFFDRLLGKKEHFKGRYIGALLFIQEYINDGNFIAPHHIPENERTNFKKIYQEDSEYYTTGIICKEEKDNIIDMINYFKKYILITINANCISYEFIPYKKIGPINLDKNIDEKEFNPTGVPYLYENGLNHVLCKPIVIDNPEHVNQIIKRNLTLDKVYLEYNDKKIEVTCYFDKFINELKEICDDLMITQEIDESNDKSIRWNVANSKKLGIILAAHEIDNIFYIHALRFNGNESFQKSIAIASLMSSK